MITLAPLVLQVPQGLCQKAQVDEVQTSSHSRYVSQLKNHRLREHKFFIKDSEQTCPNFAPEQYITFLSEQ